MLLYPWASLEQLCSFVFVVFVVGMRFDVGLLTGFDVFLTQTALTAQSAIAAMG